ncbi:MAG: heme NO-binding domain-containing protein [Planctomycetes bacterium]|nr:heme NO-binding domain-containing protein [Planctomycetota bacterium]
MMFNVFENFLVHNWGEDFFEDVLSATTLTTTEPFVAPGTYADADLFALVETTVATLEIPLRDALVEFGRFAFSELARTHPSFVTRHDDVRDLLRAVDSIIHIEVRKLYPGAATPKIQVSDIGDSGVRLTYASPRRLCAVLEGLVLGAADCFGTTATMQHSSCMHDGASECVLDIRFAKGEA